MIYLYIAAAIAFAGLGVWGKYEQTRADGAEAKVEALDSKIEQQNAAVQQTKADGDRRVAEAVKGVQAARKVTAGAQAEAARLRALAGGPGKPQTPTPAGSCPEAQAVAEIRRGLTP